jgi:periplasmic copper chaperone A
MKLSLHRGALVAAASLALASPAFAHATFENPRATPNSTYKAVVRIGHGCKGQPTLKVRVQIPEGVIAVKPMPKAGWTLETTKAAYAKSYQLYGEPVAEGVTAITWSGSLDDGHYDEFVFQARVTDAFQPGETLYIPVVQECASAKEEWTQIPAAGQDAHSLKSPAPGVQIVAAAGAPATVKAGSLTIEQPWSRATPAGAKVGGGYLRITNTGKESDRLIGGSFPLASKVEVHEMSMQDNVMRMKPVEGGLEIKPGASVELKPGGFHLMLMDLKEPLKEGQTFKGTLVFEKAGTVNVEYTVRGMAGQGAAASEHKH